MADSSHLVGSLVIVPSDGCYHQHFNSGSRRARYLALTPGRSMHREQVADILWPDHDPTGLWPRLHKAAYFARKALGSESGVDSASSVLPPT